MANLPAVNLSINRHVSKQALCTGVTGLRYHRLDVPSHTHQPRSHVDRSMLQIGTPGPNLVSMLNGKTVFSDVTLCCGSSITFGWPVSTLVALQLDMMVHRSIIAQQGGAVNGCSFNC